jgi:hypothetical protein
VIRYDILWHTGAGKEVERESKYKVCLREEMAHAQTKFINMHNIENQIERDRGKREREKQCSWLPGKV